MDEFTRAYIHAAAFTDDPSPEPGEYPEPDHADLNPDFVAEAVADCAQFQAYGNARRWIAGNEAKAGRDFWYTRQHHGCGFWDGDWPGAVEDKLDSLAKTFSETYTDVFQFVESEDTP